MTVIETFDGEAAWAEACAARLAETLEAAVLANGKAIFAGAGGSTPSSIYRQLAAMALDWNKVVVTLIDERYVPETSPESNAALMKATLLTGPAAAASFLPLFSSEVTVDRAAAVAAAALAAEGSRLDAVLLGMGEDGHILSLIHI